MFQREREEEGGKEIDRGRGGGKREFERDAEVGREKGKKDSWPRKTGPNEKRKRKMQKKEIGEREVQRKEGGNFEKSFIIKYNNKDNNNLYLK